MISSLVATLYDGASSLASSVRSNPLTTVGLLGVNVGANLLGEAASAITHGVVQLNTFVPRPVRDLLRGVGECLGAVNQELGEALAAVLRVDARILQGVVAAPIVEELAFRLPLLLASWRIDTFTSEFFTSPLVEGVIGLTGGQASVIALAILLSVAFTYAHDNNPTAGRAASLFAGGLALSHLTLRPTGGLGNAMIAHGIHNLVPTLMGAEIGTGILPRQEADKPKSDKKD